MITTSRINPQKSNKGQLFFIKEIIVKELIL